MSTDRADITTRLRQTRADMIGTDDEEHYYDCHEAAGDIERLRQWGRLTPGERQAIKEAADAYGDNNDDEGSARIERGLRGVLDRLSPIARRDSRLAALERLVAIDQEFERDFPERENRPTNQGKA